MSTKNTSRLQQVKKITHNRYETVKMLKNRLKENYNEEWDIIPKEELEEELDNIKPLVKIKEEKIEGLF